MRTPRPLVAATFTVIALSTTACTATEEDPPSNRPSPSASTATSPTPSPSAESMSIRQFCGPYSRSVLVPLVDDFAAAGDTFSETLETLDVTKETEIQKAYALIDDLEQSTDALAHGLEDAAEVITDEALGDDVTAAAEVIGDFPEQIREVLRQAERGRRPSEQDDPAKVMERVFDAITAHCESEDT